jgi:hypothetical protein
MCPRVGDVRGFRYISSAALSLFLSPSLSIERRGKDWWVPNVPNEMLVFLRGSYARFCLWRGYTFWKGKRKFICFLFRAAPGREKGCSLSLRRWRHYGADAPANMPACLRGYFGAEGGRGRRDGVAVMELAVRQARHRRKRCDALQGLLAAAAESSSVRQAWMRDVMR